MKNFFYTHCLICNREIPANKYICPECKSKLNKERFSEFTERCPKCFYPRLSSEYICKNCVKKDNIPIYSLMDYSGIYSKAIIERYKFSADKSFAPLIASFISECINNIDTDKKAVVIPVPCSLSSIKSRGWDQMKLIAKYIDRRCINAVINVSNNELQQKTLDKQSREIQSCGKYAINKNLKEEELKILKVSKVVIIDDICTTGSTLRSVSKELKANDINDICAVTWLCEL